jgi:hypothetical protein
MAFSPRSVPPFTFCFLLFSLEFLALYRHTSSLESRKRIVQEQFSTAPDLEISMLATVIESIQ